MKRSTITLRHLRTALLASAGGFLIAPTDASAFVPNGWSWPTGDVSFHVDLDAPGAPSTVGLFDGSTTWNSVGIASIADWNRQLGRVHLIARDPSPSPSLGNDTNEIFFADDIYGDEWGETTLGVTLTLLDDDNAFATAETDILIKRVGESWNAYRGPQNGVSFDLRRVLTHELGHALGLGHPDTNAQTVDAIMNSTVSSIDSLQEDDISGVAYLYGTTLEVPVITKFPESITANVGDIVSFDFEINGSAPVSDNLDSRFEYYWFYPTTRLIDWLFTNDDPDLFIGAVQPYDAGTYTATIGNADGYVEAAGTLTVNPVTVAPETKMANLSTRAFAGTGSQTLTVGFVIQGTQNKRVLVRAVGPTLGEAPFNLPGTHRNPRLTLRKNGESGTVASNDDWQTNETATAAEIAAVTSTAGGFALPEGSKDSVLLVDLSPGVYTAQVEGDEGTDGLVIVEAYDVDAEPRDSRLVNLSTRGYVGSGNEIMIAGLVVSGPGPHTYLIRAIGDTLRDFQVEGVLDDTLLKVYQGQNIIRINDDWDVPYAHQPMLVDAMEKVGAFPVPADSDHRQESITLLTLYPGAYTLQVSGFDDSQQGVALIEVYDFPED